jgi:2-haloacid dehalogenase
MVANPWSDGPQWILKAGRRLIRTGSEVSILREIEAIAVDIFGTTVDWRTGVVDGLHRLAADKDLSFGAGALADAWRERYLPAVAQINSGERAWANLDTIHAEALDECLDLFGYSEHFGAAEREEMVRAWYVLPPWRDSLDGLRKLRENHIVVALSNGGFALLTRLIKTAGLPFDAVISAENVQAYKPDVRAYRHAARLLDLPPDRILMVAAHTWDIDGARAAGLRTAFVERPDEKGPGRTADRAEDTTCDLTAQSFTELADALVRG